MLGIIQKQQPGSGYPFFPKQLASNIFVRPRSPTWGEERRGDISARLGRRLIRAAPGSCGLAPACDFEGLPLAQIWAQLGAREIERAAGPGLKIWENST